MYHRRPLSRLASALAAGLFATGGVTLAVGGICAVGDLRAAAPFAAEIGLACGLAAFTFAHVLRHVRDRGRLALSIVGTAMALTAAGGAIGVHSLPVMTAGVAASCRLGLGRCVATGVPVMPLLTRVGPVQSHPVVRLLAWGGSKRQIRPAEQSERDAAGLGQPLLEASYGVGRARDGGAWRQAGDPVSWLAAHHERALETAQLGTIVHRAQAATGWPDTAQTQWWLVADLTSRQMGMGAPACGDHIRVPGVRGVIVRLPLRACQPPAPRSHPARDDRCGPAYSVMPGVREPTAFGAGLQITIGHEFAEAATDPANGWRVLVAPHCGGYLSLEIADVCSPDGRIISAPAFDTAAGWQPSLLQPPEAGHPARCVNPARPGIGGP